MTCSKIWHDGSDHFYCIILYSLRVTRYYLSVLRSTTSTSTSTSNTSTSTLVLVLVHSTSTSSTTTRAEI